MSLNAQWIIRDINSPVLEPLAGQPIPRVTKALQVNMTVDRAGRFAFDYSPPEGYDYFRESGEKVLDEQEISSLLNDAVLGGQFSELRVLRELREIGGVERRPKRDSFNSQGEWKGTVRLRVAEGEPSVWRAHSAIVA